ncbi:PhoD-like phosphatase [Knoellia remsis]|uniref:PhoD-like phosphatase n=1 Tax=Knoellia remsis TaxID=407159 RepID=A0A2T0TTX7_9MICO|nr:alkaline phosphatase D family protein [Knoellia remsis]PRY49115.1 PhoD-like phosphatase [Knoellia remsis]
MSDSPLVLGPLLRYVGEDAATIWVQTRDDARVSVHAFGRSFTTRTFTVHGRHFALVLLGDLPTSESSDYRVDIDGEEVWPRPEQTFEGLPPSRIRLLRHTEPTRLAFGSCRTSVPHDAEGNRSNGVDALRAYAHWLSRPDRREDEWPHLVCFLGDQVYADETSDEMREYIASRRSLDEEPGEELKDFDEYAHLYQLAWSDPLNRWLFSTLSSTMIFDDHDIRDDWNTSRSWLEEMRATSWWHGRIVGGLASYWVFQHAGNLSPAALAEDEIWKVVAGHDDEQGELDLTDVLDAFAERVDARPDTYRWSYSRDLGESRLIVVDSRAARVLEPGERSILDPVEMDWLDEQLHGDVDHLFIGTSLPFLIAQGIHDLEAINEAMASGAWGQRWAGMGEKVRRAVDLEHWAAFQEGFRKVFDMVVETARGERGRAPGTITFLSGDVHNSYVTEISPQQLGPGASTVVQLVCSPIRNPLPRVVRVLQAFIGKGLSRPLRLVVSRSSTVPNAPMSWTLTEGPWFDNNLATLEVKGRGLVVRWDKGEVDGDTLADLDAPRIREVARVTID